MAKYDSKALKVFSNRSQSYLNFDTASKTKEKRKNCDRDRDQNEGRKEKR